MQGGSETTQREEPEAEAPAKRLSLQWVWPAWRLELLRGACVSLGRSDDATIRLQASGVSREHAELYRQGPSYVLRDLGARMARGWKAAASSTLR